MKLFGIFRKPTQEECYYPAISRIEDRGIKKPSSVYKENFNKYKIMESMRKQKEGKKMKRSEEAEIICEKLRDCGLTIQNNTDQYGLYFLAVQEGLKESRRIRRKHKKNKKRTEAADNQVKESVIPPTLITQAFVLEDEECIFIVIYGEYGADWFIALPNWHVSVMAKHPSDTEYNKKMIKNVLSVGDVSEKIAEAIYADWEGQL